MWMLPIALLSAAAPDLGWLTGYWLSCSGGVEVSETWSPPRGGVLLGYSVTVGPGRVGWEQARIDVAPGATVFHAQPRGQPAASFRLVRGGRFEAVFENQGHDFPQRVIYRRSRDRLIGRIEGTIDGRDRAVEWRYRAARFNARCR